MTPEFEEAIRAAFRAGAWYAVSKALPKSVSGKPDDEDAYVRKLKDQPLTVRFES